MTYEWDVFISYRRETAVHAWTHRVFLPALREWLPHFGGAPARVFVDQDSVPAGTAWPAEIEAALLRSRCAVAILSPDYFHSAWCLAEFHTLLRRQQLTGMPAIVPLRFSDGDHFDDEARALEWIDVEPFNWMRSRSRSGTRTFTQSVKGVCERVAQLVRDAPAWDPDWTVVRPTRPAASAFAKPEF